jgi:3-oxoacyl-ACP reductase-like protein
LLAVIILSGCGGSSTSKVQPQTVTGPGFSFSAPAGWQPTVGKRRASASHDDELVQVAAFPLLKPYRDALFARVERELNARMQQVAAQTGGTVSGHSTVTTGGIRAHSYEVSVGDHVDQYTFVLQGMREFQLLCRRKASSDDEACKLLLTSFKPA